MADNVIANAGAGGATFATDDIASVHYPRSKVVWGPDGTANDADVASGKSLPVQLRTELGVTVAKLEDAAHASGDPGIVALAIQKATPANQAGTDGDYEPLQVSAGRLWASATIDAALPAGTNAIGKLAANSGVDIGDIDVTSVVPGTGATSLGKAVDSAGGATDTGVAVLVIRDDTLGALTPADGDYTNLRVNSQGALHVTGGGGGTQYAVDDALGATPTGTVTLAVRDDALSTLTPVEGDAIALRVDSTGRLWASATIDAALPAGTNAIGKLAANSGVDIGDVDITSIAAGDNNIGNVDIVSLPAIPAGTNNIGDVDVLSIAAGDNNIGNVDIVTMPNVTLAAGTNTNEVVGDVAHDSPVGGNPLLEGLEARTSDGTAVASGDVVRAIGDTLGKQVVLLGAVHDLFTSGKATYSNTTASDVIAAVASTRIVAMNILVTNKSTTVATKVEIRDGTTVKIQADADKNGGGFALGSGYPLLISTANTALTGRCVTTGADVDIFISGYKIAN